MKHQIKDLEQLVQKAHDSMLFTAPILGSDLKRFLNEQSEAIRKLAQMAVEQQVRHIHWVGSGNSWVNLYLGKYILDKFSNIPSDCFTSYEFVTRNPHRLDRNAWVFLASFSGATEDTVMALKHAKKCSAYTIALVREASSLMGQEADCVIPYSSIGLYILPMAAAVLFSLEIARLNEVKEADEVIDSLYKLPELLTKQYLDEKDRALLLAHEYAEEDLFYVLGTGPLYGLAYKFGLTVFMENMRIHGSFIDAAEFRHGPVEMLDRLKPVMVILNGTDETRKMVERVIHIARSVGKARVIVYDLAEYPSVHPFLAAFALMIPLQWFAVYSSLLRGITDLDERVYMGHGILGKGDGITWP